MKENQNPLTIVDFDRAIKQCQQCDKFHNISDKSLQKKRNIIFCTERADILKNKKYLPCILNNISEKCMAEFLTLNIDYIDYSKNQLWNIC